jgi:hypothetical protein
MSNSSGSEETVTTTMAATEPELPMVMGVKVASAKSGLSVSNLWNHISCGNLKVLKIGARTIITREALREFLSHSSEIPAKVKRAKPARANEIKVQREQRPTRRRSR